MRWLLVALAVFTLALPALVAPATAIEPDEVMDDPVLEARARAIAAGLRCLVCQNQSVDESDSSFAKDVRLLIRERLLIGDGDRQIMDFMVERYGEFILLRPYFAPHTYVLWFFTPFVMIVGIVILLVRLRRRKMLQARPDDDIETSLTGSEKKALYSLMQSDQQREEKPE